MYTCVIYIRDGADREKAPWDTRRRQVAVCKPRREAPGESNPAHTFALAFLASRILRKPISGVPVPSGYGSPSKRVC